VVVTGFRTKGSDEARVIKAADTKAILRILSEALPDQGEDLLTSIHSDEGLDGQLEVRLNTRDFEAISKLIGLDCIEGQILQATYRPNVFFSLREVSSHTKRRRRW
jgi:hypothetical protein